MTDKKTPVATESDKARQEQAKNGAKPYADANLESPVNPYNPDGHSDDEGEKGK